MGKKMTTEAASGFRGVGTAPYDKRSIDKAGGKSDEEQDTPDSTPEIERKRFANEYAPPVSPSDENLSANWTHTDDESDENAPFTNHLNNSFSESVFSDQYTHLSDEGMGLDSAASRSSKNSTIRGSRRIHLSKRHKHWRIKEGLERECLNDEDLGKTIEDALHNLDSHLGDADVVAYIETDNEKPSDPRPLIRVTMPVEDANDWHNKKTTVRELVQEVRHGDATVYTTVDRKH